jgi:glycosyltransferase involved in cell wall biosynthesis
VKPAVVHVASGREWRGGQRQVWLLARELERLGIKQVVVTGAGSELAHRLGASGVRVRPATWRAGLDPRVLGPLLAEVRRGPAVLHAHDAHALTLAGLCARLTRTPLVVTRRVTFPLRHPFFWRRACRVITISRAVRDALLSDGLEPARLVLIPSALDPELKASVRPDVRRTLGIPEKEQLVVNPGALTPEKDHSTLISAAALLVRDLPGLHWVVVGDGPLRERLQQEVTQRGLQDRFHLVGDLPDPHAVINEADVLVLSSTSEGLGSSILAAMDLGVPVVATRVGGIPDLVGSGGGLLVAPGQPEEFAAAVRRVLTEPGLSQKLTTAARQDLGKFSVSAIARQVLTVYRSCAHTLEES